MFLPFACLSLLTNLIILQHAFLNNCVPLADNLKKKMKRRNFGEVKKVMKLWESTLANNVFSFFLIFLPQLTFTYD